MEGTRHSGDSRNLTGWRLVLYDPLSRTDADEARGHLYRSTLWAVDLGCFEIVKEEQQPERQPVGNSISKAAANRTARRAQLRLPFLEEGGEDVPEG